jgi:hypothetical protein
MSYLKFENKGQSPSGKIERWSVENSGAVLGWIEWHSQWRRYWFCPLNGTGLDTACLDEISAFLKAAMAGHQSVLNAQKILKNKS